MRCVKARRLINRLVDKVLPAAQIHLLQQHLDGCPTCVQKLASYKKINILLQLRSVPEPPEPYWDRAWARIATRIEAQSDALPSRSLTTRLSRQLRSGLKIFTGLRPVPAFSLALAAVLFLTSTYFYLHFASRNQSVELTAEEWQIVKNIEQDLSITTRYQQTAGRFSATKLIEINPITKGIYWGKRK
ncbi:zf-HC2 domain-containing protein [candidate division KSB1 bacterium]|nr:zf-HC2 domain-containing protein [candidate division KSB1 bacterium]